MMDDKQGDNEGQGKCFYRLMMDSVCPKGVELTNHADDDVVEDDYDYESEDGGQDE